jgi:catechol 2,3-dioxygenase-like lactoylglutathione lyase family enzyme
VHVQIRRIVPDLQGDNFAASREFYENVLGLKLVIDQGWVRTFAAPDNPAAQITMMQRDATAPVDPGHPRPHCRFHETTACLNASAGRLPTSPLTSRAGEAATGR